MKKILLNIVLLIFIGTGQGFGQMSDYVSTHMSPELKQMITEAHGCSNEGNENCSHLFKAALDKGIKEKVSYLEYLYFQVGFYYYKINQLDSAMIYTDKALSNENREDYDTHAGVLNLKGSIYFDKGNNIEAINHLIMASKILEENRDSLKMAYSFINIGVLLGSSEDNERSMDYFQKAYGILSSLKDSNYMATLSGNITSKYFDRSEWENSKLWAHRTMKFKDAGNNDVGKASAAQVLSLLHSNENNTDSAFYYGKLALEYAEKTTRPGKIGTALYTYAIALNNKGMKKEAAEKMEESIRVLSETDEKESLIKAYGIGAELFAKNGDYKKASEYYAEYKKLYENLLPEKTARIVSELNTQFETEKKEKQIAEQELKIQKQRSNLWISILGGALAVFVLGGVFLYTRRVHRMKLNQLQQEKENAILNSFIQGEERERNRISAELHDGVAAMIGAAKMSLDAIPHLSEEKQKEQFEKIKGILENTHADVRHIVHNLMPSVLEKEGIIKASEHFASEINQTKLVSISVEDNDSRAAELPKNLQLMLFRVIQELVSNIIKHSQAQNATISFSRSAAGLNIEVTDDGVGYEGDLNSGNQGLYSISQRLKSIGGNFKFIKRHDRGMSAIAEVKI